MLSERQTRKLEKNVHELKQFVTFARNEHLHPSLERDAMRILFANVNVIARESSTNDAGNFERAHAATVGSSNEEPF